MSDDELRRLERDLVAAPADLELRRRHARLLQRAGQAERALEALDLAWRLGAEELWDELQAALAPRALTVAGIELRFVPGGPFVMGADDHDEDAAPAHLVTLSGFWMSAAPVPNASLRDTPHWRDWWERIQDQPFLAWTHDDAMAAVTAFASRAGRRRVGLATEAQWERVARASLQRRSGQNPYGVERGARRSDQAPMLEWTADAYHADAYQLAAVRDPRESRPSPLRVIRGAPLPPPAGALHREGVTATGDFAPDRPEPWDNRWDDRVKPQEGLAVRVVLQ